MIREAVPQPERIRERLAGHHILLTGSTGFLAKAFLEKLLRAVDTVGRIYLLVRARSDGTSVQQRVAREVISSRAFDRLRASMGEGFSRLWEEKIQVVQGDLLKERFGMDRASYDALTKKVTVVVNSAATVTFDERIDLAVELNTLGPQRLLQFARDCGPAAFLHVSTCYVCGVRQGSVAEDFSAPEAAVEGLPKDRETGAFDLDELVSLIQAEAAQLRHRFGADTEACRRTLIDAGMTRARNLGWSDTYTFTKWIGEQLLVRDRGDVPLVIFRPAIIESSFEEPMPGWIDGLRMADPIIMAYGRGKLNEFPARPELAIDFIPADFVANAMIATLPVGKNRDAGLFVYHCASSNRNPHYLKDMRVSLERAFRKKPMSDEQGRPIRAGHLRLTDLASFVQKWSKKRKHLGWLQRVYGTLGVKGRRYRKLAALIRQVEQVVYFAKIYSPYTHLECRFNDDGLQSVAQNLHADDRAQFPFDPARIDWDDYLVNRHIPGLRSYVAGSSAEPTPRILAVGDWERDDPTTAANALQSGTLFEAFQHSAQRFARKPALQVRRGSRWVRYTYEDALRATGMIMRRFLERGLRSGDRVAICGESGPEWGLTYLAVMRAGMTAIPLDPQLPADEAWAAARFAEAKLMCVGPAKEASMEQARESHDANLVSMQAPFIPKPGASRDVLPEPITVADSDVASILFTSGTTIHPKAVQLSHRNLLANAKAIVKAHRITPGDELLSVLPMYHVFEFTGGFLVPITSGATITYVEQLKGPDILAAMQSTGTTIMLVVPRLLQMFHSSLQDKVASSGLVVRALFRLLGFTSDLTRWHFGRRLFRSVHRRFGGRLRMFVSGGSALDPFLFDAFLRMGFSVYEGYGLTETAPVLTVNRPGCSTRGSVGPPLPGVEVEIRNQNLEGIGEIWVQSPGVMLGYLKDRQATDAVIQDGWFRTGDLGRVGNDNQLHLTGRSSDLIVTGAGKNVYPDEVERRYCDLPYTKEVCVFGVPADDGLGDAVNAVVVVDLDLVSGMDRSSVEREIRASAEALGETLPSHQRIATFHFWDRELPKTSTLKAKRGRIRDMVLAEGAMAQAGPDDAANNDTYKSTAADIAEVKSPRFDAIRIILAPRTRQAESAIVPRAHLHLDLGIDSIGKMDVIGAIEARFHIQIDADKAADVTRVADLIKIVGEREPKGAAGRALAGWQRRLTDSTTASQFDRDPLPIPLVPMRWLVRGGVGAFMNSYVRVRVKGLENIPASGPFVLAANHSSHLDSPSVMAAIGSKRRVWVAGAEDYFFNTALKRLLFGKMLDTIPFDRRADGVLGLRRCAEALGHGDGLLLFPEGTRSTTGLLQPFKIGIAVLALAKNAPIIPVYIDRAYELLPKGHRMVKPGTITVWFGSAVCPPGLDDDSDRHQAFLTLTRKVEAAVTELAKRTAVG